MDRDTYFLTRIEMIEHELEQLKKLLLKKGELKAVSLCGLWRDVDISDEEIEEARHALKVDDPVRRYRRRIQVNL